MFNVVMFPRFAQLDFLPAGSEVFSSSDLDLISALLIKKQYMTDINKMLHKESKQSGGIRFR